MKTAIAAAALVLLAACSKTEQAADSTDRFAGLDGQVQTWRRQLVTSHPLCQSHTQKCEGFEVVCKAEREVTAADQAKGVTAKVVAAITWTGFDPKGKQPQLGTETAEFAKAGAAWTRSAHKPVNLSTCADL